MTTGQDYFSPSFMRRFYAETLGIAQRKIAEQQEIRPDAEKRLKPRLATGGNFSGFFLWDTVFCCLWAKYEADKLPVVSSLDNFYLLQREDGFLCREFDRDGNACWSAEHPISQNPPLLSWAEWELFRHGVTGAGRLAAVLPLLKQNYAFIRSNFRLPNGLYFSDALGGGMDDLPRMPADPRDPALADAGIPFRTDHILVDHLKECGPEIAANPLYSWNRQMAWIDFSAQMAFNALNLAKISETVGADDDARYFREEHWELAERINRHCWDEERGFYFDATENGVIPRFHIGAMWTLIAGVTPPERRKRMLTAIMDRQKFNRPNPIPALPADDPDYRPESAYWSGVTWPCTTYMVLRGLRDNGFEAAAQELARKIYHAYAELFDRTGTVWENISPEQSAMPRARKSGRDFCGWGALIPIAVAREFLGLQPESRNS